MAAQHSRIHWWFYRTTTFRRPKRIRPPRPEKVRRPHPPRYTAVSQPNKKKPAVGLLVLLFTLVILLVTLSMIQSRMRPQIEQLAGAHIQNLASHAVNEAVSEAIENMGLGYDDLIHFEKDAQGRITALKTDMVMANRVKSDIHNIAMNNINSLAETDIKIPLGGLLSGDLVVGRGPKIPVRLVPVGSVHVGFSSRFNAAGINQTLHQIIISISTDMSVLLPGASTDQRVDVDVCIAETVIVGVVPEAYAELNKNPLFNE